MSYLAKSHDHTAVETESRACVCVNVTHHRILSQIIIRPSCYSVQLHQVVKVRDFPVHPFLMTEKWKSVLNQL